MKIIINASLNYIGGGLQVALSFINECVKFSDNSYYVMMGPNVAQYINTSLFPSNFNFYSIPKLKFWQYGSVLSKLETLITPDIVFSIFGPVFWRPKAKHVMGFAMGHYLYPDSPYWEQISIISKQIWNLKRKIHFHYFKRDADAFVLETEDAANRLGNLFKKKCFIVPNTYSSYFEDYGNVKTREHKMFCKRQGYFYLLSVCTPYPHKNLSIIPKVLDVLYSRGINNVCFVLTIAKCDYDKMFSKKYSDNIMTTGVLSPKEVPVLYSECDVTFVPSLLECFTANFPESMVMGLPIMASDLGFSHSICKDAALYFDPLNPEDIADKIVRLSKDRKLYDFLVQSGKEHLGQFYNSYQRAKSYLDICKEIYNS